MNGSLSSFCRYVACALSDSISIHQNLKKLNNSSAKLQIKNVFIIRLFWEKRNEYKQVKRNNGAGHPWHHSHHRVNDAMAKIWWVTRCRELSMTQCRVTQHKYVGNFQHLIGGGSPLTRLKKDYAWRETAMMHDDVWRIDKTT